MRHTGLSGRFGRQVLAPGNDIHAEGLGVARNASTNLAKAHHAEALARERNAVAQTFVETPCPHVGITCREIARAGQDQRESEFCRRRRRVVASGV
jgi:hypothetical protein